MNLANHAKSVIFGTCIHWINAIDLSRSPTKKYQKWLIFGLFLLLNGLILGVLKSYYKKIVKYTVTFAIRDFYSEKSISLEKS